MEKKKFPKLYPLDLSLEKYWFVKYPVPCYTTGKWKYKKYSGMLNLLPTVEERLAYSKEIFQKIETFQTLDLCTGYREFKAKQENQNFASIAKLCYEALENLKLRGEIEDITYVSYKSRISAFVKYLSTLPVEIPFGSFSIANSKQFIAWMKSEKKHANGYINSVKTLLCSLWSDIISEKEIKGISNPWDDVKSLAKKSTPFMALSLDLEKRIAQTLPSYDNQLFIFSQFIYYDFIRITEIRKMKIHSIDFDNGVVRVSEAISRKSKKERVLVIPKQLLALLKGANFESYPKHYYIFSINGEPGEQMLGKNYFNRKFKAYREAFEIPEEYKLYGFKHTGNSKLAAIGVNAQLQKEHNGHASLEYTQRYNSKLSHTDLEFLRDRFPTFAEKSKSLYEDKSQKIEFTSAQLLELANMINKLKNAV